MIDICSLYSHRVSDFSGVDNGDEANNTSLIEVKSVLSTRVPFFLCSMFLIGEANTKSVGPPTSHKEYCFKMGVTISLV